MEQLTFFFTGCDGTLQPDSRATRLKVLSRPSIEEIEDFRDVVQFGRTPPVSVSNKVKLGYDIRHPGNQLRTPTKAHRCEHMWIGCASSLH
jgi:hypothetical protein